jgi:hypothetical protein
MTMPEAPMDEHYDRPGGKDEVWLFGKPFIVEG